MASSLGDAVFVTTVSTVVPVTDTREVIVFTTGVSRSVASAGTAKAIAEKKRAKGGKYILELFRRLALVCLTPKTIVAVVPRKVSKWGSHFKG
jgi:hypothetical protein